MCQSSQRRLRWADGKRGIHNEGHAQAFLIGIPLVGQVMPAQEIAVITGEDHNGVVGHVL